MPLSPIVIIYCPDGKVLSAPVAVTDDDTPGLTGFYAIEFEHRVYTILKDYFYALLYGVDFVRKHDPMAIVKEIDKTSVQLMDYLTSATFLPKVKIRWYQYNEKTGNTEEYFRMTLEHVRLHSIKQKLPDVKNEAFERYGHLEELQFMYQKITWLFKKGTILYTDIWNGGFFDEFSEKDFSGKKEEDAEETPLPVAQLTITFNKGTFIEPKEGLSFGKRARIRFTATVNRKPEYRESLVYAKLYSVYNSQTADMALTEQGHLRDDGTWETECMLRKPDAYEKDADRKPDATVEYYVVIENAYATNNNFKSDVAKLPKQMPEEIGCVKIKLVTKGGYCFEGVVCSLDGSGNNSAITTNGNGEALWADLPFNRYNVTLEIGNSPVKIIAPWLRLDDKPFEYLFRTALPATGKIETPLLKVLLNALGYKCGKFDDEYGSETEVAVKDFQGACGITVDGIAEPVTCQLLLQQTGAQ